MDRKEAEKVSGGLFAQVYKLTKIDLCKRDTQTPDKLTSIFTPRDYTRFPGHEVKVELSQSAEGDWNYLLIVSGERLEKYFATLKDWLDSRLGNGVCAR